VLALHLAIRNTLYRSSTLYLSIKYYQHNAFRTPHYTRNTSYGFLCSPFDEYYEHNSFRSCHARNTPTCDSIRSFYRQMLMHTMVFDFIACTLYFTCLFSMFAFQQNITIATGFYPASLAIHTIRISMVTFR
jgi:hypothetical protein